MSSTHGALAVFGSGPGVGRNVAALFAERGYQKVVLLSRGSARLAEDAAFVRSGRAETVVHEIPVDLGKAEQVQQALVKVTECIGAAPLECVLFNAARLGRSELFDFSPQELEADLSISIVGLYAVAQWAMPQLLKSAESSSLTPSLLVTSGMLAKDPFPAMFSLATCKAGQYNLARSLHEAYETRGVHCAVIIIAGKVSEEAKATNPRNIAEEAWKLSEEPRGQGRFEVTIEDPAYLEHVKNRERQ